jgi:hypothetical protein
MTGLTIPEKYSCYYFEDFCAGYCGAKKEIGSVSLFCQKQDASPEDVMRCELWHANEMRRSGRK